MRRALLQYLSLITLYLGALPLLAVLQLFTRLSFWPHIPSRLKEELQGVASGAHLGLPLVLLINTLDDLANNLASCSALAVGEGRTAQGLFLAGRNLDYPVFVDVLVDLKTLFLITPDQGVPLVSLAWPGYVGVLTGMNRAGVALAQLTAMCRDTTLKGLPAGLRHRLALEQETTVQGVAARILEPPRTIGNNLLLCGPREALVLEVSAHRHGVRRPAGGVITATNHFQSDEMEPVKGEFRRRPPSRGPVPLPLYRSLLPGPQHSPSGTGGEPLFGAGGPPGHPGRPRHCQSRHGEQHGLRPGGTHPVGGPQAAAAGKPGAICRSQIVGGGTVTGHPGFLDRSG